MQRDRRRLRHPLALAAPRRRRRPRSSSSSGRPRRSNQRVSSSGRASPTRRAARGSRRRRRGGGAGAQQAASAAAALLLPNELEARLRRDTPFICNIRFKNDLPEIPSDPKLLLAPPARATLAAFSVAAMERGARRDLLLPGDVGVPLSLLDAERYSVPPEGQAVPLDPKDAALLQGEIRAAGLGPSPLKPKRFAAKNVEVSWLMRTTYISATDEAGRAARRATAAAEEGGGSMTREEQIEDIEASFAAAQRPVTVHPNKRGVVATEVLPLLPDFDRWPHQYIQVVFDEDPTADGAMAGIDDPKLRRLVADRTMLKSFNLGEGEKQDPGLALLVPKDAVEAAQAGGPLPAGGAGPGGVEGDYLWDQEFTWAWEEPPARGGGGGAAGGEGDAQDAQDAPQVYLLRRGADRVVYSALNRDKKLKCRKRKRRAEDEPVPAKVVLTHRELSEAELEQQAFHPDT